MEEKVGGKENRFAKIRAARTHQKILSLCAFRAQKS